MNHEAPGWTASKVLLEAAKMVENQGVSAPHAIVIAPPLEIGVEVDIQGAFEALRAQIRCPKGTPLGPWVGATPRADQAAAMRRAAGKKTP